MLDLSNVQALVHHFVASMGYPWIPSWSLVHRLLAVLIIFLPMNVAQVCSVLRLSQHQGFCRTSSFDSEARSSKLQDSAWTLHLGFAIWGWFIPPIKCLKYGDDLGMLYFWVTCFKDFKWRIWIIFFMKVQQCPAKVSFFFGCWRIYDGWRCFRFSQHFRQRIRILMAIVSASPISTDMEDTYLRVLILRPCNINIRTVSYCTTYCKRHASASPFIMIQT